MHIVADENIPLVREAFARYGTVETCPGRGLSRDRLLTADALLVRSVTKVDAALLEGTPVRFIATATIGEDHIDKAWLAAKGIGFSSAPGCNANSVAEYLTAALLVAGRNHGFTLAGKRIGIVGAGHVGSKVAEKAIALGMTPVLNDPPLAKATGDDRYRPLDEALASDVVTLHVPLIKDGPYRTLGLADAAFFARIRPGSIFVNTARGDVADPAALAAALDSGTLAAAVLDVWPGEPVVDPALMARCAIATPHIAGYSYDGKVNGTRQIHDAFCAHFGLTNAWDPAPLMAPPAFPEITIASAGEDGLREAVLRVYDIEADDRAMRGLAGLPESERGAYFDNLRKAYPQRHEFGHTRVNAPADLLPTLAALGFRIE